MTSSRYCSIVLNPVLFDPAFRLIRIISVFGTPEKMLHVFSVAIFHDAATKPPLDSEMKAVNTRIELYKPAKVYTNLDFVKGKVIVSLKERLLLEEIEIKLVGTSETRIRNTGKKHKSCKEIRKSHYILNDMLKLLPVSGAVLDPGEHGYEFKLQFPLYTHCVGENVKHRSSPLPPTFNSEFAGACSNIQYAIKAVVRSRDLEEKDSVILSFVPFDQVTEFNQISIKSNPLNIKPSASAAVIEHENTKKESFMNKIFRRDHSICGTQDSYFKISVDLPNQYLTINQAIELSIRLESNKGPQDFVSGFLITVASLTVKLLERTEFKINDISQETTKEFELLKLANIPLDLSELVGKDAGNTQNTCYELEILPRNQKLIIIQSQLEAEISSNFQTCDTKRSHTLGINITFGESKAGTFPFKLMKVPCNLCQLSTPITVLQGQNPPSYVHRIDSFESSHSNSVVSPPLAARKPETSRLINPQKLSEHHFYSKDSIPKSVDQRLLLTS